MKLIILFQRIAALKNTEIAWLKNKIGNKMPQAGAYNG